MQAVLSLARIAKEDAVEAFKLYFEPLLKILTWLRNRSSGAVGKEHQNQLLAAVEAPEATKRSVETLDLPSQVKDDGLWRILSKASLDLIRPEPIRLRLSSLRVGSLYVIFDTRIQAPLRIRDILSDDAARMDALWSFASIERAPVFELLSTASLHSLRGLLGTDMAEIKFLLGSGKADLLEHLLRPGRPPEERRLLLKHREQAHLPEAGDQSLKGFGIYLEVAAFLAQEGYEEAAVAVVTQAFKLFRPGELVNPTKEEK